MTNKNTPLVVLAPSAVPGAVQTEAVPVVVVDEGSSQTKVAWMLDNTLHTNIVPAGAKLGMGPYTEHARIALKVGDFEFHASTADDCLQNNNEAYQTSPQIVFATHQALIESGFSGLDVHVCVTLPIGKFFSQGADGRHGKDEALIALKRDNLLNTKVSALDGGQPPANIVGVSVHSEGKPAFVSAMLDSKLQHKFDIIEGDVVLMIDIGDTTTDISEIAPDGTLVGGVYSSIPLGVSNLRGAVIEGLRKLNVRSNLGPNVAKAVINTGIARISGTEYDVSEMLTAKKNQTFLRLATALTQASQDLPNMACVCVVGGGAEVYREQLAEWFPRVACGRLYIPDNHETALAEGILLIEALRKVKKVSK